MFVVVFKEREMEIGYPTDVKHVAHIGWDGPSGSAPSWVRSSPQNPILLSSLFFEVYDFFSFEIIVAPIFYIHAKQKRRRKCHFF